MLNPVEPWNEVAEGYAQTTMQLFKNYAHAAMELAQPGAADYVLDLACGPGTLSLELVDKVDRVCALDFSPAMLAQLQRHIATAGITNIHPLRADGQCLPCADAIFDQAYSMFGLMFFPERAVAYAELWRTLKPGGKVVIASWAPIVDSPSLQLMFGMLEIVMPELESPQAGLEVLADPKVFTAELQAAGFGQVSIQRVSATIEVDNIDAFWQFMAKGAAPLVMARKNMSTSQWQECEQNVLAYLRDTLAPPCRLTQHAWLALAEKSSFEIKE